MAAEMEIANAEKVTVHRALAAKSREIERLQRRHKELSLTMEALQVSSHWSLTQNKPEADIFTRSKCMSSILRDR
jgi:hypothetical protein